MSASMGSLNLSTQERRIVVVTGTVLFLLLNFWLVWPRFQDWSKVKANISQSEKTLETYRAELARTNDYQLRMQRLEKAGSMVLPEDQQNRLISTILAQATRSRLATAGIRPVGRSGGAAVTNRFFEEQTVEVGINPTLDKDLVDFLVSMGSGDSMIRVKDLHLSPDLAHYKLQGKMQLVASFQKKPAPPPVEKTEKIEAPKAMTRTKTEPPGGATNAVRNNPSGVGRTNAPAIKK